MPPLDTETIARHAEAVRRLAHRLVWDEDRAEDVAQDALVAALEQRTPPRKGLEPWLRGATRKLAANAQRKERRLLERHARLGAPAPAPAPDEVIQRLHAQRLVGDALLAVGEPYRRTLYMRYFDDLPPRAIAAQLGLPVNTVRTHLRRGREKLRLEIQARSDKRRPWQAALLPLLAPRVPTPTPVAASAAAGLGGTLLMLASARYAVVLLAVLLLGGGIAYWMLDDPDDPTSRITEASDAPLRPEAPTLQGTGQEGPANERTGDDAPAPATPSVAAPRTLPVVFEGRVSDPNGRQLAGVSVRLHPRRDADGSFGPTEALVETVSDEEGRFEIRLDAVLAQGSLEDEDPWLRLRLVGVHPRWLFAVASFGVDTSVGDGVVHTHRDIDLRFKGTFSVRCRVVDDADRPVAGATCRWGSNSGYTPRPDGRCYEVITDAEGLASLEIPVMPTAEDPASVFLRTTGVRVVHAEAEGYAHATSRPIRIFQPTLEHVIEAEIVLPAPHTVTGRVLDDRGEAVPDLTFAARLHRKGADLSWNHQRGNGPRTDARGGFTLENVPPGAWTLEVWAPGYVNFTMPIEVPSHDVTLSLVRKTTIEVHYLRPDGTPLRAGLYHAVRQRGRPFSPYGHARGRVPLLIDRLLPGRYRITVNLIGRMPPFVHDLEVTPGPNDARTFTVPVPEGASVEGRLLDSEGAPLAGLASLRPDGAHRDDSQVRLDHPVDARGSFRFEGLSPGRYVLRALAEDHASTEQVLEVTEADPAPIELQLHRGATLRVRLPRSPSRAAGRWQLQLLTADGSTINVTAPQPDEDDWLVFPRLPAGTTTVLLESSSFRAEPVPNDPYVVALDCDEGQTVEHAFPRLCGVTLQGRVLGPGGKPRAQYKVCLHRVAPTFDPPASMADMGYGWKDLFTNDEGRFEAPGLLPGRYVAVNVRQGGVPVVIEVKEGAGQTVELHAR